MKTIWKFNVPVEDEFVIEMPIRAEFLSVQTQFGVPQMWFIVEPEKSKEPRRFRVVGTGHPMPEGSLKYLGTFQVHEGSLVFHLFEILR